MFAIISYLNFCSCTKKFHSLLVKCFWKMAQELKIVLDCYIISSYSSLDFYLYVFYWLRTLLCGYMSVDENCSFKYEANCYRGKSSVMAPPPIFFILSPTPSTLLFLTASMLMVFLFLYKKVIFKFASFFSTSSALI